MDFEKRWDNAEERIRVWSAEWKKMNVHAEIKFMKEELITRLPNNDLSRYVVAAMDEHKAAEMVAEKEAGKAAEKAACERLSDILTKAILKDLHRKGKTDRLMGIAVAPDSVKKMKKYITEGLENSGKLRTKAAATQFLSDINGLKLTAIGYIANKERAAKQNPSKTKPLKKNYERSTNLICET